MDLSKMLGTLSRPVDVAVDSAWIVSRISRAEMGACKSAKIRSLSTIEGRKFSRSAENWLTLEVKAGGSEYILLK